MIVSAVFLSGCKSAEKASSSEKRTDKKQSEVINSAKFKSFYFEGIKEKSLENYEAAGDAFGACLKMAPDHAATLYQAGIVSKEAGNGKEALDYLKRAVENDGSNRWYLGEYAELLTRMRRHDEAGEVYSDLISAYPDHIQYYYKLANSYIFSGNNKKAIETYDRIEEKFGFNEDITKQKFKLYQKLGDEDKAETEVKKLIEHFPRDTQYRGMLANLYRNRGENEKALEEFKKLRELDPDNPMLHLSLADFYEDAGRDEEAFKERKAAFANADLDIDNKIRILMNYYEVSRPGEKLTQNSYELLEILEETHPDDAKTFAMYGDFLIRDDRIKEARDKYRRSLKLDSSRYMIWNRVLMINSELDDNEAMIEESAAAIELFPAQPLPYLLNGLGHLQDENYREATLALEQGKNLVVDNPPMEIQFYSSLGDAYYKLEKYGQSWMNYERALRIDPDNEYVLNNYAYFLSLRKEKLDLAREMSRKTVKRNPDSPTYLDTYAWVLYQSGEYEQAKEYLERALQNGGDTQSEILEHYGDVMYRLNDTKTAVEYWKKAREAGEGGEEIDRKIQTQSLNEQ